ncbi:MAG: hypothetical protein QM346_05135, partial [Chloroflexota bacterium]|nr:hypothetical protein [Chloroflexota bacterium]
IMAIQVAQLQAMIGADTRGLERGVSASRGLLHGLTGDIRHMASTAAGFIARDLIVGGFNRIKDALTDTGRAMVGSNRDWETYTTQFTVQLKSQEAALRRLAELEEFAMFAPGGLDDLIQADIILQNFGIHAEDAARRWGYSGREIRGIAADTAAGSKASFEEISTWFGRFAAGDTGRAIMRLQELGVVTREQLRQMGVEFDKAGSLTTPVDEAFAAMLRLAQEKFGGLTQIQSETLAGMQEQLEDWNVQQKRVWGEPVFDAYKEGLSELLSFLDSDAMEQANDIGLGLWESLTGWAGDVARDWAHQFISLAADAFHWGANIVRELAAGITGSDYVAQALDDLAAQLTYWLAPGSPPRLLPDLTRWGMGAADAYFAGWSEAGPAAQAYLNDLAKSVAPYLEDIDLTGAFSDDARAQMEAAFGSSGTKAAAMEYAEAYAGLRQAMERLDEAKARQAMVAGSGDQAAIDAAQEELDLANEGEVLARRRMVSAQMRLSAEARAQMQLANAIKRQTDATKERGRAEEDAARKAADREAEAERRRQEAEAKRIADARLRWELAQQDTAGQIGIWQRELSGVEEGSAEYYDILTRIIGLEDRLRREREGAGGGGSGIVPNADETKDAVEQYFHDSGAHMEQARQKVDWGGIGKAIAGAVWDGFRNWVEENLKNQLAVITEQADEWSTDPDVLDTFHGYGVSLIGRMIGGMGDEFGNPELQSAMGGSLLDFFVAAIQSVDNLLGQLMTRLIQGMIDEAVNAVWRKLGHETPPAGGMIGEALRYFSDAVNDAAVDPRRPVSRFARGTGLYPGGWGVVGEEGPELVKLPSGSQILPADETVRAIGGSTNMTFNIFAPGGRPRDVEIGVRRALRAAGVAG